MARENRKENRAKAREAAAAKAAETPIEETDEPGLFDDIMNIGEEEENEDFGQRESDESDGGEGDFGFSKKEENASGSESLAKKPNGEVASSDVDSGVAEVKEEDLGAGEAEDDVSKSLEPAKTEEPADGEKKPEAAAATKEPAKAEPKPKEGEKAKPEAKAEEEPKTLSDDEARELFSDWRTQTESLLAEHHYKLTDEQVDELNENPAAFIPRLASRVYLDSISAAFQQFVTYLPRMVDQVIEQRTKRSAIEEAFFTKWPDLRDHRDTVLRLGAAYRGANPSASVEDFINEVGAQAVVALRLAVAQQAEAALSAASQGGKANGKVASTPAAKAFKPAVGTSTAAAVSKRPTNVFEQMASEFGFSEEDTADFS